MIAGAITGGQIELENDASCYLASVIDKMREAGVDIQDTTSDCLTTDRVNNSKCIVKSNGNIKPVNITTLAYPGMPTDMQAQFTALLSIANGTSVITERVFPHRFMHVAELNRMGANIRNDDAIAIINGVSSLYGTTVMASDLRASASLIVAGLAAKGITEIRRLYHIDRGYEKLENRLTNLGAKIWREKE
jgi:UDP-N-acetylglucosamine 1-carboxyvinyltransferase